MAKPRNRYGFILKTNYNSNLQTDTEYHEIHAIFTQSCMQTIKYMTDKTVMQVNHKDKTLKGVAFVWQTCANEEFRDDT